METPKEETKKVTKRKLAITEYLEHLSTLNIETQKALVRTMLLRGFITIPNRRMLHEVDLTLNDLYKEKKYDVSICANTEKYRNMLIVALVHSNYQTWMTHTDHGDTVHFQAKNVSTM